MFTLEIWIAGIMLIALTIYALSGGADFGSGVWALLATGPRARAQRKLIAQTLAPIWEANHVWLILVVVLLFVAFPLAFAAISTALHIPLTIMLIGIVLRGSAFTFRAYGIQSPQGRHTWRWVFAVASIVTPVMLGIILGAVASGVIGVDRSSGQVQTDFFSAWLAPFPLMLGLFALALFAFLAAVYLALDTNDPALQEDFRRRALVAAVIVDLMAGASVVAAKAGAPLLYQGLSTPGWSFLWQIVISLVAVEVLWALWKRHLRLARVLAIAQTILIIWGWGLTQFPYVVPPDLTLANTAAPVSVLGPLLIALVSGALVLVPAFWYLYSIFFNLKTNKA
jgi:cytochrome d ubiquinol oxidase subunit II